jgi:hypothetical protein
MQTTQADNNFDKFGYEEKREYFLGRNGRWDLGGKFD